MSGRPVAKSHSADITLIVKVSVGNSRGKAWGIHLRIPTKRPHNSSQILDSRCRFSLSPFLCLRISLSSVGSVGVQYWFLRTRQSILEEAEAHHSEVTGPLHGELAQIKDGMNDASTARSRLFDTCDDESLWQQLRELSREGQRLVQENQGLQSRLAYLQSRAEQQSAAADKETNEVTKSSRKQIAKDLLKEADELRRTMKANSLQSLELAKRSERTEQQMREW